MQRTRLCAFDSLKPTLWCRIQSVLQMTCFLESLVIVPSNFESIKFGPKLTQVLI